ncbi:uncharacterized protein MELLADRAFT_91152 [Melampsora larici-populina 98AG31]|uniref:Uncharacterized protein n=1 Tax=Melampsora larici-populina (strain 98AG31 / pathotype 3-4-7) TaxID=747676 RepID=F4RY03_MELLP|nr:uncharacterized protein MELLADRAFT_91152 [Melampsora larici-populina 98AG31]EGG02598.1 hypothetical protein MELLADRAFT_91152 [Melampsora larici-populina 98AG31]
MTNFINSPGLHFFSHSQQKTNTSSRSTTSTTSTSPKLPHNPFSCLESLRSLNKNFNQLHTSNLSTGLSRLIIRSHPSNSNQEEEPHEELVWKASQLIWSKGSIIYRKFDFSDPAIPHNGDSNQNHIIQALFANFDHPSSQLSNQNSHHSNLPQFSSSSSNNHQSFQPWSDNRPLKSFDFSLSQSPVRALCVLLLDVLKIYYPTGEEYTIAVPFPIAKLWPIERGILAMKKPISVQATPFIPYHPPSPASVKRRSTAKRLSARPSDPLVDSMITENETRWWSSIAGYELNDEGDYSDSEADQEEAQLRRYWAERKEIESSMLWTLSDPSTAPLTPLVTPPRKPGCSLPSGTVVFVADPTLEPLHPVCVTASTEGFTIFLCGRLPPNISDGIVQPSHSSPKPAHVPTTTASMLPPPPPRLPTPPNVSTVNQPQLRRSPRKLVSARRNLTGIETDEIQSTEANRPSRLASLGHPSLRRSISSAHPRHPSGSMVPLPVGTKNRSGTVGGPSGVMGVTGHRVSNASNSSFHFGGASSTSGLRRASGRKSLVGHQLEIMSGGPVGSSVGPTPMTIDRASGPGVTTGFEEWFAGVNEPAQAERVDGQLTDETLDPEWVIERLQTVEIPDRLSPEDLPAIHAAIYDVRGPKAYLAVCIPSKGLVFTFRMTRVKDSIRLESFGPPTSGTAIGPVLSTRPHIFDLFKADGSGSIEILSADSMRIHKYIDLPTEDVRVWPLDPLVLLILQALAQSIDTVVFSNWLSSFVTLQLTSKPAEALDSLLSEVIIGESPGIKNKSEQVQSHESINELLRLDPALSGLRTFNLKIEDRCSSSTPPVSTKPLSKPSSPKKKMNRSTNRSTNPESDSIKIQAMIGLGKLCAELSCSTSRSSESERLIRLMLKLTGSLGWTDWTERLRRMAPSNILAHCPKLVIAQGDRSLGPTEPLMPELTDHLERIRAGSPPPHFYGDQEIYPRSKQITKFYSILFDQNTTEDSTIEVLLEMDKFHWKREDLDDVPWKISLPIREGLRECQFGAPIGLSASAYELIDRPDLAIVVRKDEKGGKERDTRKIKKTFQINTVPPPSIQQLSASSIAVEKSPILASETDAISLMDDPSHVNVASRFSDDMRIIEVARMLNYTKEAVMSVQEAATELSPADIARQFSNVFIGVSKRTMALPFGGACFWYRTDSNIAATVPLIKLDVKVLPMGVIIQPDQTKLEPLTWPRFHAGVAAALSLSVLPGAFDGSQIAFDRPDEPDDRHAGYLFGLGLNGHLRSISRLQIYRYLETKHEMTSIGLLLGLSGAFIGTGDSRASSIIAAHVPALHPTKSVELQVSPLTQSAGFVSFGLLHLGTGNRRLSDGMLRELARTRRVLTDTPEACRETYTLCAGLGYGLVMLGRGTESNTPAHKDLMRTFKSLIHGDGAHPLPGLNPPTSTIDVSVTSPAATLALALLYLKTGRQEAVTMCEIPQTETRLEYIRPDLLMIRTLAKCLIKWDTIEAEMSWMESLVPKVIIESVRRSGRLMVKMKSEVEMIYWSIVTGAALGMALKHAGTASAEVHKILLSLYDRLLKGANQPALSVQGNLRRHCLRSCRNVITLGLGIVMAGTGELEVLRRLRIAHANINDSTSYGTHLATHFALGMLFLGGGRFTLSTSDTAIACLLCSVYPIFPSRSDDQIHHLQPLRHVWVLAVEPRCVIARDVDRKGEMIYLPLKLKLREIGNSPIELRNKVLTAPTLVPELDKIRSVRVESPRYWPLVLDLEKNPIHKEYFNGSRTIWVKRKVGHLSYLQDPKGTKSIACRGRGAEEIAACAIDDLGRRSRLIRDAIKSSTGSLEDCHTQISGDLDKLIRGFELDGLSIGLVDYICSKSKSRRKIKDNGNEQEENDFASFVSSSLLQCLIENKMEILTFYFDLYFYQNFQTDSKLKEMMKLIEFYKENLRGKERKLKKKEINSRRKQEESMEDIELDLIQDQEEEEENEKMKRLIDLKVLEQIDRKFKRKLDLWSKTETGGKSIKEYLDSNGIQWPKEIEEIEMIKNWIEIENIPLPKVMKTLRKLIEESFGKDNEIVEEEMILKIKGWLGRGNLTDDEFVEKFFESSKRVNRR